MEQVAMTGGGEGEGDAEEAVRGVANASGTKNMKHGKGGNAARMG